MKKKGGFSIAEIAAAIAIIGIASATLTSMVLTSYKSTLRGEQYTLSDEIARTYDSFVSKDITKTGITSSTIAAKKGESSGNPGDATYLFTTICDETDQAKTYFAALAGATSYSYGALFGAEGVEPLQMNDTTYTSENVKIEIQIINKSLGYYKLKTTVSYVDDREVSYEALHFAQ